MKKIVNRVSISGKIWMLSICIFLVILMIGWYSVYLEKQEIRIEAFQQIEKTVAPFALDAGLVLWLYQTRHLPAQFEALKDNPDIAFLFVENKAKQKIFGLRDDAFSETIENFRTQSASTMDNGNYLLLKHPIIFKNDILGYVFVGYNRMWLGSTYAQKDQQLIMFSGGLALLLMMLTFFFSNSITKSLRKAEIAIAEFNGETDHLPKIVGRGDVSRLMNTFSNLTTNLKSKLEESSQSQDYLRTFFHLSPIPILVADEVGKLENANQNACDLFELDAENIGKTTLEDLLGASDYYIMKNHIDKSNGKIRGYVTVVVTPSGSRKVLELNIAQIENALEKTKGFIITIIDVTDKIEIQHEILENQNKFSDLSKELLSKTQELSTAYNQNEQSVQKLADLLKLSYQIVQQQSLPEVLSSLVDNGKDLLEANESAVYIWDSQKNQLTPIKSSQEGQTEKLLPLLEKKKGGLVWQCYLKNDALFQNQIEQSYLKQLGFSAQSDASLIAVPISDQDYQYGVALYLKPKENPFSSEDMHLANTLAHQAAITIEKIHLVKAFKEKVKRLESTQTKNRQPNQKNFQLQKLESLSTLVGGIAHGFNNILGIITPNVDLLRAGLNGHTNLHQKVNTIDEAAQRAIQLTSQLLTFSRNHPVTLAPISINRILIDLLENMRGICGEEIEIVHDLNPAIPNINGDEKRISQAITNIVQNAKEAMPNGGKLVFKTIVTSYVPESDAPKKEAEKFIRLSIKDSGNGIQNGDLYNIFDPFFTTKGMSKFVGLGLSEVYGIVKSHNGYISVESAAQKGSVFHIYFPPYYKPAQKVIVKKPHQPVVSKQILLVDDEPMILESLRDLLQYLGYAVTTTSSGRSALKVISEQSFGMAIVDFTMPEMDGIETITALHKKQPNMKFVLTSGYADKEKVAAAKSYIDAYLPKPYQLDSLEKLVNKVFSGKQAEVQDS